MGTFNFSRSQENDITIKEDRLFDAIFDVTRSDSESVDFESDVIKMDIYKSRGRDLVDTLSSASEITVATAKLTFAKTFTDLEARSYYYTLYNDTDKVGIAHGKLIVL